VSALFKAGDRVCVKAEERAGHIRTPWYVRGKFGWVERVHGEFRNPEQLAYGRDGLPRRPLYMVGFRQMVLWPQRYAESPQDSLYVDIYEHWLEPVGAEGSQP
jgi:hypothetical protein